MQSARFDVTTTWPEGFDPADTASERASTDDVAQPTRSAADDEVIGGPEDRVQQAMEQSPGGRRLPTRRGVASPRVLLDRYEVGRPLRAGDMAEVFEGRDRLLARRVAIKVLQAQFARDPSFLIRFKREAQALSALSNPNIVGVYDTGTEDGTHFIVMEYVEGRTVKDVIRAEGPLYPERAAEIASDVCSALVTMHARGLIHRDIKSSHVMLTPDGKVKVIGFAIVKAIGSERITQTATVVGTAQYMSPEQAQGQTVDYRSDLYSLGCCLYEMLTGTIPFTGATPEAIAYRQVREDPTPPRQLDADVPAPLEAIILKAMAKLPDNRYQTAAEMHDDLQRFRNGQPVQASQRA